MIDVLLPSLHHGIPVYACRFKKFDPLLAFSIIEKRGIRNMFMPPTALKLMRSSVERPREKFPRMRVRSIGSGGESLGDSLLDWGRATFPGVTINEFYGQTEVSRWRWEGRTRETRELGLGWPSCVSVWIAHAAPLDSSHCDF